MLPFQALAFFGDFVAFLGLFLTVFFLGDVFGFLGDLAFFGDLTFFGEAAFLATFGLTATFFVFFGAANRDFVKMPVFWDFMKLDSNR